MNKKAYIQLRLQAADSLTWTMVCASGVNGCEKPIEYGGVDEDGILEPSARRHRPCDVWEDEEEEYDETF